MRFVDRVAIVTGGGGHGLGGAIARSLAGEGARVAVADRDRDMAESVAAAITAAGGEALAVAVDVRRPDQVEAMAETVFEAFGGADILVNNAFTSCPDSILDADLDDWMRDVDVILKGAFLCARAVLPAMRERRRGAIVNVSTVNAHTYVGASAYSAAKAGVESLSRSIAVEYARHGIRSNVVVPGTFATEAWELRRQRHPDILDRLAHWYPTGRIGRVEEIAAAVLFLASDEAGWITGATLPVDGGLLAGNPWFARDAHPDDQPASGEEAQ
ncbi:oxidoreductase [Sphaerisporangium siamense]|uniref:NAD(P)-dependent dehydrogenase (Short-subunit alcohol dehydrogenase family) n=1 Tax=Sphaerisporangium siamense TaxID=795645 RepID=A0A7W7G6D5_9ACTN|nr:SDR family NAD(P)-dependent oxidoreductase [Sphaerisporangium siamense]MBB4699413.1 NAD(P)-dependent dehydrogenase (short-subunit alcohol dehydrogenase family) [Sphaerisporangium siamense]GII89582.1 oxidoreductase [Sphaerisporangium siamense]